MLAVLFWSLAIIGAVVVLMLVLVFALAALLLNARDRHTPMNTEEWDRWADL